MELFPKNLGTFKPVKTSLLNADDINGPGDGGFPRPTGVLSVDFALFAISKYARAKSLGDRQRFVANLPRLAKCLGRARVGDLLPLLALYVSDTQVVNRPS